MVGFAIESYPQTKAIDVPLVSDKTVTRADTLKIVGKDEQQRIVNQLVERIQKLEDRIFVLEAEVRTLKIDVEEGL